MPVRPLDTLIAIKVLGLVPGLNANDRRVGAAILEHYNRKTTRCDPGLKRIADLLGISERTVIRCCTRLEHAGLFKKVRHGGRGNRNRYEPDWERFSETECSWRAKMNKNRAQRATKLSPASGQECHVEGDNAVTQTCSTNLNNKTCVSGHPKKRVVEGIRPFPAPSSAGKRSGDAARDQAERRWTTRLTEQFRSRPVTYAEIVEAITPEIQAAATDAELRRHGAGIEYVVRLLKLE